MKHEIKTDLYTLEMTTDRPESSHGIPVAVINGSVYGPDDMIETESMYGGSDMRRAIGLVADIIYHCEPVSDEMRKAVQRWAAPSCTGIRF